MDEKGAVVDPPRKGDAPGLRGRGGHPRSLGVQAGIKSHHFCVVWGRESDCVSVGGERAKREKEGVDA